MKALGRQLAGLDKGIVDQPLHPEAAELASHLPRDVAETDQAESPAVERIQGAHQGLVEDTAADLPIGLAKSADQRHDEGDDMVARLGLSPDLRLGQGSSSQPPSGLAPLVSGAGTSGSRSEERGQVEGVLDPLAEVVEVTPGSQTDLPVPQEQSPVPAAQEVGPQVIVTAPRQTVPSAPRAPEAGMVPKPAAGQTVGVPAGTKARGASPQARLVVARSG